MTMIGCLLLVGLFPDADVFSGSSAPASLFPANLLRTPDWRYDQIDRYIDKLTYIPPINSRVTKRLIVSSP